MSLFSISMCLIGIKVIYFSYALFLPDHFIMKSTSPQQMRNSHYFFRQKHHAHQNKIITSHTDQTVRTCSFLAFTGLQHWQLLEMQVRPFLCTLLIPVSICVIRGISSDRWLVNLTPMLDLYQVVAKCHQRCSFEKCIYLISFWSQNHHAKHSVSDYHGIFSHKTIFCNHRFWHKSLITCLS